jgi:hypothetical protein
VELLHTREENSKKEKSILLFETHHVVSDATSMGVIIKELQEIFSGGSLEPLTIQYKDYAVWQYKLIAKGILATYEKYWLDKMKDFKYTQLPFNKENLSKTWDWKEEFLEFEPDFHKKIDEFCKKRKITRFSLLVTVLQVILARETRQNDVNFGARITNRNRYELENIMGYFLDKIIIRSIINREDTCFSLLTRVNQTVSEAINHAAYPFDNLRQKLMEMYDIEDNRLVSIIINYLPPVEKGNVSKHTDKVEHVDINTVHTKYDLDIVVADGTERLSLKVVYRSHLYSRERIKKILNGLMNIISSMMADPRLIVGNLNY